MKREDLFESIGMLDEELIRSSERSVRRYTWSKWAGIAACLALAFGVAVYTGKVIGGVEQPEMAAGYEENIYIVENNGSSAGENEERDDVKELEREENKAGDEEQSGEKNSLNTGGNTQSVAGSPKSAEKRFVDIGTLLASGSGSNVNVGVIKEQVMRIGLIPVGQYVALYTNEEAADSIVLGMSLGEQIAGAEDFYKVSGHNDLQYLIRMEQDGYTLWKFQSFQSEEYPYSDVLRLIYDIDSAEDFVQIVVEPATMDNSDAGKAIQKEIGTLTVSGNEEISEMYEILSAMTCYGSNHWDLIGLGDDEPEAMQRKMRLGRYLEIETVYGNVIDGLKYTGVSDMFYEYSGIAYGKLEEEQQETVETILKIEGSE